MASSNQPIVLETRGLKKCFYEPVKFEVLKGISLSIHNGEFISIVGKSGCGKSTLLYCMSTMDSLYDGELYIGGELVTGKKEDDLAEIRNRHLGFVFQFHYLLPEFTCLQNVMLPAMKAKQFSYEEIEHRALQKLDAFGLKAFAGKVASKLSGGQQQRVAIARALINDPAILMCDEPTGNLDSENSRMVFEIFKDISKSMGQTVVCVTHDHDFARSCDRIIEMADGKMITA